MSHGGPGENYKNHMFLLSKFEIDPWGPKAHFRGPGAPKPSVRTISSRAMIAETHRSIIFKVQRNWIVNSIDRKIEGAIRIFAYVGDTWSFRGPRGP